MKDLFVSWLEGYAVGFGMIILIGPVFFTLLYTTLKYGLRAGIAVAFGISLSDALCVLLLVAFRIDSFIQSQIERQEMRIAAALLLIGLGTWYTFKRTEQHKEVEIKTQQYLSFILKGFSVNLINPFVFVAWLSISGHGSLRFSGTPLYLYLAGTLMGIFTTDLIKVALAKQIKQFLRPDWLKRIYIGIGFILILLGLGILVWQ